MRVERRILTGLSLGAIAVLAAAAVAPGAALAAPTRTPAPLYGAGADAIKGEYIVVYREGAQTAGNGAEATATARGANVRHRYTASVRGFSAALSDSALDAVRLDPDVAYVQADAKAKLISDVGSWGLDRIDQRTTALDHSYTYDSTGRGVNAYVIDTGVRTTHTEFTGRIGNGHDFADGDDDPSDCNGHGTHVAGTIGGTTYGVAKEVTIHPVRVLDCGGNGTIANVVAGIDWVSANHVGPSVANMSLRWTFVVPALDDAVRRSIASGVTYVLAAGNEHTDACGQSPPRVAEGITVGATTNTDTQASFSNFGTCLDIYAPGQDITSSWATSDTATNTISGTSMAAPHTTGVAAAYLQRHPRATPRQVRDALVDDGTADAVGSPGAGSPNVLLHDAVDTAVTAGDLDADGRSDLALAGPTGWGTIPVAFSTGGGAFSVTNGDVGSFGTWAATPGVKVINGDFNGDGRTDIALTGPDGWTSVPVAFSNGDGSFTVTNFSITNFGGWAAVPRAKVVTGDFNADGRTDLALTGPKGWGSVPVAFSNGDGSFTVTNFWITNFAVWAAVPGAKIVTGDFNGDHRTDLAITGPTGWGTVPVASSNGDGSFAVANEFIANFATWASVSDAKVVTGDFNGDGLTDLAITGPAGWGTVPVAFSNGNSTFSVTNESITSFAGWASVPDGKVVAGDFNADGRTDLALTGPNGWSSVPVAFSNSNGSFHVKNRGISEFAGWAAVEGVVVIGTPVTGPR